MFKYLSVVAKIPGGVFQLAQSQRIRAVRRLPIAFGWLSKRPFEREISDSYVRPAMSNRAIRRDVTKFVKSISPEYTQTAAEKLGAFDKPVLIAWAADDRFFSRELGERLAARIPNARLEFVEDSRTFMPEDQPTKLAGLIAGFVREPAPAAV